MSATQSPSFLSILPGLLENETLKVLKRKRWRLVLCVLAALLTLVVFAQARQRRVELPNAFPHERQNRHRLPGGSSPARRRHLT